MGIAIFFVFLSIIVIVVTVIMVKKNNRLYNYRSKDANKRSAKERKRDIKSIWEIEQMDDGIIVNSSGQSSIIMELGSIEYRLLNESEQSSIDAALTRISRTLSYNMQFFSTTVKVDTNEKIDEIKENLKRQKNTRMTEYGEAIIEYLEDIMQEDDLYVRKSYIIISTYEPVEDARRNLILFCNTLKSSLNDIKISAKILDFNRVIDLLNKEINKNSNEDVISIIKKGGLEEFVKKEKN